MKEQQEKTKAFCQRNGLISTPEARLLDTVSELGEVAKEMLKSSAYGQTMTKKTDQLELELGDTMFSLMALANALEVDLEEALEKAMEKYGYRIDTHGSPASGGKNGKEPSP